MRHISQRACALAEGSTFMGDFDGRLNSILLLLAPLNRRCAVCLALPQLGHRSMIALWRSTAMLRARRSGQEKIHPYFAPD